MPGKYLKIGDAEERLLKDFPDAVLIHVSGNAVFTNTAMVQLLGLADDAPILGSPVINFVALEDRQTVGDRIATRWTSTPDSYPVVKLLRGDGAERLVQAQVGSVSYRGAPAQMAILRDVTARIQAEQELRVALSLQMAIFEATTDAILVVNRNGDLVTYNRKFAELAGESISVLEEGSLDGTLQRLLNLVKDHNAFIARLREVMVTPDLESFDIVEFTDGRVWERHSRPQKVDGETVGIVWTFKDISESRRLQAELAYQANHDPLTGVLNRRGFGQVVENEFAISVSLNRPGALIVVDIDYFKDVNDRHGHLVGDRVLVDVVAFIKGNLREGTAVGRLGGDEFAILLPDKDGSAAATVARRILGEARTHAFQTNTGESFAVTLSAGLILFPADGTTVEQLMSRVDLALYDAKEQGRDRTTLYATAKNRAESRAA